LASGIELSIGIIASLSPMVAIKFCPLKIRGIAAPIHHPGWRIGKQAYEQVTRSSSSRKTLMSLLSRCAMLASWLTMLEITASACSAARTEKRAHLWIKP
jgi:hypothetical protein